MTRGEWNRYEWTREQLQSYLNAFTGQGDITVVEGQGLTHLATKMVALPVGDPDAADTAAHEGVHILRTDNDAWKQLKNPYNEAEGLILNAIEDARMELAEGKVRPGLFVQWQMSLDRYMPVIVEEDWLLQSIKGIYMECGGYTYPRSAFKPKARKLLTKFDTAGIKWRVRNAPDTFALVPLVYEIIALFDEAPKKRKQPQPQTQPQPAPPDEPSPFGSPSPSPQTGPTEGETDTDEKQGTPQPANASDGQPDPNNTCDGSLTCAHCNALEQAERAESEHGGVIASRSAQQYNADDARAADEMARKNGSESVGQGAGAPEKVDGYDEVTGGPSVNRLLERAKRLESRIKNFEKRAEKALSEDENEEENVHRPLVGSGTGAGAPMGESPEDMPREAGKYANTDRLVGGENDLASGKRADRWGRQMYDWDKILPSVGYGGTGYSGVPANVHDGRKFSIPSVWEGNMGIWQERVLTYEAKYAPIGNYLGKQMRIWLQSQDRSAMRDHERFGLFDPRRSAQMAIGNFDVYRNPPKNKPARPMVTLSVDMSSSMHGYSRSPEGIPNWTPTSSSFHAVISTWLMARALAQINTPFEVIGFGGGSDLYIMKAFEQPFNDDSRAAIANVATLCSGGTPAAEGLALSWVRALTRPEKRKIVIQVTDGHVAGNTAAVAKEIRQQGGIVIGVGIGNQDDDRFRELYGDGFAVRSANELPPRFVALLRRLALTGKLR